MKNSTKGIILAILLVATYSGGRYLQPAKIETKTKIVEKEVIVERKNVVTVIKEVKRPDGTVETETRTEDKSETTGKKDSDSSSSSVVTNNKPQWRAGALVGMDFRTNQTTYGALVERRILGPASLGVYGTTNQNVGLSLSLEF